MNNTPIFSIVIPVYNAEQYLNRCIQSVLNQTFSDFELILVNDGSTDNSLNICENFAENENRIKIISHKNNGVSFTRNKGIKAATGKYITFIDSDDFVDKSYLESFYLQLSIKETDIIASGIIKYYGESEINITYHVDYSDNISIIPELEKQNLLSGPFAKCFKRDVIVNNKILFDKDFSFGEDAIFNLTFVKQITSISAIAYAGYYYYQIEGESLVKKKYPFETSISFVNTLTSLRYDIFKKFNLEENYIPFIEKERTLYTIGAIKSAYNKKFRKNRRERIKILDSLVDNLKLEYLPKGKYYRLLRVIFELKNYKLMDYCLLLLSYK